jgi:hypothetical protein
VPYSVVLQLRRPACASRSCPLACSRLRVSCLLLLYHWSVYRYSTVILEILVVHASRANSASCCLREIPRVIFDHSVHIPINDTCSAS